MVPAPEVDVVVRYKNEEFWLRYLLRALTQQKDVKINLIAVDNNSSDYSTRLLEFYAKKEIFNSCRLLSNDTFRPGKALNIGANAGEADYIVNLSAHCVPVSNSYLKSLVAGLNDAGETCAGVFGQQRPLKFSGAQNIIDLILAYPREPRVYRRTPIFNNANSIIKREIFLRYQFNESVTNLEDFIWAKSILTAGYELKYLPEPSVYHYHGLHQHESDTKRASGSLDVLLTNGWITLDEPDFLKLQNINLLVSSNPYGETFDSPLLTGFEITHGRVKQLSVNLRDDLNYDYHLITGTSGADFDHELSGSVAEAISNGVEVAFITPENFVEQKLRFPDNIGDVRELLRLKGHNLLVSARFAREIMGQF